MITIKSSIINENEVIEIIHIYKYFDYYYLDVKDESADNAIINLSKEDLINLANQILELTKE